MQIAQVLAGYTLGGADLLRRAMGKKKAEEMAKQRAGFLDGRQEEGRRREDRQRGLRPDGEVRRSTASTSRTPPPTALITNQTAWLKAHYPVEFMAALLTCEKDNTDKVVTHIAEARADGHRGAAARRQRVRARLRRRRREDPLRPGRHQGRGRGGHRGDRRGRARKGPSRTLFDFCERVDIRRVNRKVVRGPGQGRRLRLREAPPPPAVRDHRAGAGARRSRRSATGRSASRTSSACWSAAGGGQAPRERLRQGRGVDREGAAVVREGGDRLLRLRPPARAVREGAAALRAARWRRCSGLGRDDKVTVAGIVAALRERPTKTGKRMAWVTLEDLSGSVELVCFPGQDGGALGDGQEDRQVGARAGPSPASSSGSRCSRATSRSW